MFEGIGKSPLASTWLPEPSPWALPLALLAAFVWLLPRGAPGKAIAIVLWLPLLWPYVRVPGTGEVEVTAIDVGQGLAVLVRTRSHALLYDMGPAVPEGFDAGERSVIPALHARGVGRVDTMVVSHGDLDHAGGLASVRSAIDTRTLLAPPGSEVAGAAPCLAGDSWEWDGVRFRLLHPPPMYPYLANESSCVLRIEGADGTVLLTGDIGGYVERLLLETERESLRADIVFAGHHGSRHSSDPAFVAATGARHVVFSTGNGNWFRHPARTVVERWEAAGARTWNTADAGAITLSTGPGGIAVVTERTRRPRVWDAVRSASRGGTGAGLSYLGD